MITAEIVDGHLVVKVPANAVPVASKSGKTNLVASTGGFTPIPLEVDGKMVSLNLTATVKA